MKILLISGILAISFALTSPMATWADNIEETATAAQFEKALPYVTDSTMKYTFQGVNIRKEPNTESDVLGQTILNTTVEVVLDLNGWSMITTQDGFAYIKSEYLSDEEIKYTDEDLYIMAHLIAGEAQPYSDAEQRYVGSVALNRIKHDGFPNTLAGVVFDTGQYACVSDGNFYREPTESNWVNAKWLLENGSVLPGHVIFQSRGKQGNGVYLKTKWHTYCY